MPVNSCASAASSARLIAFERLDVRVLLSASLDDGVLRIEGTRRYDDLSTTLTHNGKGRSFLLLTLNHQEYQFRLRNVTSIQIITGRGDDNIRQTHSIPTSVASGAGNDTILLFSDLADDTILAGDGDDSIQSGNGDDFIECGSGNDTVIGSWGSDTINGGAGDDDLAGDLPSFNRMPIVPLVDPDDADVITGGLGADIRHNTDNAAQWRDAFEQTVQDPSTY